MNDSESAAAESASPRRRLTWLMALGGIGLLAILVGLTLMVTATGGTPSFGWYAYSPLAEAVFTPVYFLATPQGQTGLLMGVVGLAVVTFSAGWALGARR
ncbi:hypothetical protein [Leifsonia sp. A12D58]|uniref:hypothetical protein n=1 Tax=Leifsonia sp. A12D58 TaxID=3397674 RepID=UPI0039E0E7F5